MLGKAYPGPCNPCKYHHEQEKPWPGQGFSPTSIAYDELPAPGLPARRTLLVNRRRAIGGPGIGGFAGHAA
jgi:hypothetical protein